MRHGPKKNSAESPWQSFSLRVHLIPDVSIGPIVLVWNNLRSTLIPNICFWIKFHIYNFLQEQVFKIPLADVRSMRIVKPKKQSKLPSVDIYYGIQNRTKLITIFLKQVTAPFTACPYSVVLVVKVFVSYFIFKSLSFIPLVLPFLKDPFPKVLLSTGWQSIWFYLIRPLL